MTDPSIILKQLGLSDKEVAVYLALLEMGPSSVRQLAERANVNRGTTYDILKGLKKQGLVSYFHKKTHQYFVAEDPERLIDLLEQKRKVLDDSTKELRAVIPELKSIATRAEEKPVVKYYEGSKEIASILKDVLETVSSEKEKEYCVYSAADIREHIYTDLPSFNTQRKKLGIHVKVIALGSGGELSGDDERKWLTKNASAPTYEIIYGNKVVMISVNSSDIPIGVLILDVGIATTQKLIFDALWKTL